MTSGKSDLATQIGTYLEQRPAARQIITVMQERIDELEAESRMLLWLLHEARHWANHHQQVSSLWATGDPDRFMMENPLPWVEA